MLENYYKYRIDYKDCLLFFRYGSFYELFDKDAYIMNKIFNYSIKKLSNNIKCGFPVNSLDNVLNVLDSNFINYYVIDKNVYKSFDNNRYNKYKFDKDIMVYNLIRIDKIIKYLNDNLFNEDILNKIESIINEW